MLKTAFLYACLFNRHDTFIMSIFGQKINMKKAVTESVTAINMKTNFNTLKKTTKVNIMMENKTLLLFLRQRGNVVGFPNF